MELRTRRLVLAGAAVGMLLVAGPAEAASSVTSGWWTSSPLALAPDVADDQLLVQGGSSAEEPTAYAGVSFVLDEDEEPTSLTLTVAPESASTPAATLALCALDAPATAAAGEPADGAPAPMCAVEVEAEPSDDGTSYTFDVVAFAAEGSLDLAVLPTQPTDRVVLEAPTVAALTSTVAFEPLTGGFGSNGSNGSSTPSPAPSTFTPNQPTSSTGSFSAPRNDAAVTVPRAAGGSPASQVGSPAPQEDPEDRELAAPQPPTPFEPAASTAPASGGSAAAALLLLVLAAAAATLWMVSGNGSGDLAAEPAVD